MLKCNIIICIWIYTYKKIIFSNIIRIGSKQSLKDNLKSKQAVMLSGILFLLTRVNNNS